MNAGRPICVYLAGPLFTQAEWQWNERLAAALEEQSLLVLLPQRAAEPMLLGTVLFDPNAIFQANIESLERADALVAILDGADVDSGTAWECGYAFKAKKPVIGVRTDIRAGGDDPRAAVNLMLSVGSTSMITLPIASRTDVLATAKCVAREIERCCGLGNEGGCQGNSR
jgi:nucleoside 2-deoxyribosyltransferase